MRPTLLNFRNPIEKTPEYHHPVQVTYKGDKLNFRSSSVNKKRTNFPLAKRFPLMENGEQCGGASSTNNFNGPGRYNDHENFQKLVKRPCSSVMKKPMCIPASESKKPCYIMIGDSIKFEPALMATHKQVKEHDDLNLFRDNSVSIHAAMNTRSVTNLKRVIKERGIQNIQTSREELQNSMREQINPLRQQVKSIQKSFFRDQTSPSLHNTNNYFSSRPTSTSTSKTPGPGNGRPSSHLRQTASLLKPSVIQFNPTYFMQEDGSNFDRSISGNGYDRSASNVFFNLDPVQENNEKIDLQTLSVKKKLKVKSILPKNAFNYYSLRKGLYLQSSKKLKSTRDFTQVCTIANAYESVIPVLKSLEQATRRSKTPLKNQVAWDNSITEENDIEYRRRQQSEEKQKHLKIMRKLDYQAINQYMNDIMKVSK